MKLPEFLKSLKNWVPSTKVWIAGFLVAGLLLWINDRFFFESIQVTSSSMRPTLLRNEWAYLQRTGIWELQRLDVVVINSRALDHRIVKRIIGLPGDTVRLENDYQVLINGEACEYDDQGHPESNIRLEVTSKAVVHEIQLKANPKIPTFETRYGKTDLKLGTDEYYVLGDNRLASGDSRYYGVIKRSEIQGKLRLVWYSYDLIEHRFRWERVGTKVR